MVLPIQFRRGGRPRLWQVLQHAPRRRVPLRNQDASPRDGAAWPFFSRALAVLDACEYSTASAGLEDNACVGYGADVGTA